MSDDLTIDDIPWESTPMLLAGMNLFVEKVGRFERLKWAVRGVSRRKFEVGLRTSRGNEYAFASSNDEKAVASYVAYLQQTDIPEFINHLKSLDDLDVDLGHAHKPSDAVMAQWKEICYAWADVVPGDFVFTITDQEVETVDGRFMLPSGSSFSVRDVLFDKDHSVLSRSQSGDVAAIPWRNFKLIAKGQGGEGREENRHYIYSRESGYIAVDGGERGH